MPAISNAASRGLHEVPQLDQLKVVLAVKNNGTGSESLTSILQLEAYMDLN